MTFALANLNPIGGQSRKGKGHAHWAYDTLDAATTIDGAGYFNAATAFGGAYNLLELGDHIHVTVWGTALMTGTVSDAGIFIVNGKNTTTGQIDVTNAVDMLVTDAD